MIALLVDVTRCVGCYQCVQACTQANRLGESPPLPQASPDGLSAHQWTTVVPRPGGHYVRKFCRHCLDPACVSVCPVGAMYKTPQGPVLYDAQKCMGCRYCMMACPFGIPRYEWDSAAPLVRKCTFCYDRLQAGGMPACVEACQQEALVFGDRSQLIDLANRRIERHPGRYLPRVFGQEQVGGTSVLYLSDIDLSFLGYHGDLGDQPLPELSWTWLSSVTPIGLATTGLMAGLYWIIGRRMRMQELRNRTDPVPKTPAGEPADLPEGFDSREAG
jgi:formate dehydrogenase iron-sulfur subunit